MKKLIYLAVACLFVFTAIAVSAKSRRQPFKFEVAVLDAKTLKHRSTFYLGESVILRISLTNQSRTPHKIPVLEDTEVKLILHSTELYEDAPEITEGSFGGTFSAREIGGVISWIDRQPQIMTIAPGQTLSKTVDLSGLRWHPIEEGTHTLTAHYNPRLRATISFRVVVDEAKSIPLLAQLAATPVKNGDESLQRWAQATLNQVREPSISGRIIDSEGRPLDDVTIYITGSLKTNAAPYKNGLYKLDSLSKGGTYTIKPEIYSGNHIGAPSYKLEPESKTISLLDRKVTNVDFIATRIRESKNVAVRYEGSTTRASSIRPGDFETENVIDDDRDASGWGTGADGWNDGTPNAFPDWIEVDFGASRTINWINVFTLPDDFENPPEPSLTQKFSLYGITDFDVQYWTGRAWLNVPGGAIRNNRNVWRMISFAPVATNKIRVVVRNALGGESRITEIEAFHVNDLPQAKIAVAGKTRNSAKAVGYTNSPVHFRLEAFDRDGTVESYELDFGDDTAEYEWRINPQKAGDKPPLTHSHVYESKGTYTVKLRVVDYSDESTETTLVVTIIDPPQTQRKPALSKQRN